MSVPSFLIEMLNKQYGQELTNKILEGYKQKRKVTFRVNTLKSNINEIKQKLKENNIEFEEVLWSKEAIILKNANESDIAKLDIYEEGKIYLQSLSSMLPPIVLNPQEGENILDMTAAPGSKTTQMAALSNNKSMITACEVNKIRSDKLKYNIERQGVTCTYVMKQDSRYLDDLFSFDKILLDAPCSGSGTINEENKNLEKIFTKELINKSRKLQETLLYKALKLLKPGKEMVYSTCSILQEENENILEKVSKKYNTEIVPIKIQNDNDIPYLPSKIAGTICVCPNEKYEGFFIAKIKKNK